MIIHCRQCGTRYRISEEKVKPGGTRVRCVRCRHVFRVMPEKKPSAVEKIFPQPEGVSVSPVPERGHPAGPETAKGPTVGLFRGVPSARQGEGQTGEKTSGAEEAERRESVEEAAAIARARAGGGEEKEPGFLDDPAAAEAMEKDLYAEAPVFGGDVMEEASVMPSGGEGAPASEPSLDIASPETSGQGRSMVGKIFILLLFLVVILCSGMAGYLFWRGEPFDIPHLMKIFQKSEPVAETPAGTINLKKVTGFYVINQEVGQLFVISGTAVNQFAEARSGISVRGILYDDKGRELRQQTVFCGNPFEREALATLPYKTIEENMNNPFGTTFSNLNIAPGKEIPFMIVFRNLPENLAEFSVEVVGSKSASEN